MVAGWRGVDARGSQLRSTIGRPATAGPPTRFRQERPLWRRKEREAMARSRIRSAEDETGRRLIRAGQTLIRTGTAIEELTVADVLQLIEVEDGVRWTAGTVYPRFGTQEGLRNAVLVQLVKDGPHHRDHALSMIGRQLLGFPADGVLDLDEPAEGMAKTTRPRSLR